MSAKCPDCGTTTGHHSSHCLHSELDWEEAQERQALLSWALDQDADWCASFDADEQIEDGGAEVLREFLTKSPGGIRAYRLWLTYTSHHRLGYLLPSKYVAPWRLFKLDNLARSFRFEADVDGRHCGTVPFPHENGATLKGVYVIHHHAHHLLAG